MAKDPLFFKFSNFLLKEYRVKDEHFIQGKALRRLMGKKKNIELELALIKKFGADFREIIEDFKKRFKKLPTTDDLLWIAGVHANKDPFDIAKDIIKSLGLEDE